MREYLDEKDTVGAIRLELSHPASAKKVWVLVEGVDDTKLYRKLLTGSHTSVEEVYESGGSGIAKLKKALAELRLLTNKVFVIRDADFLRLNETLDEQDGLFYTDCHDAEMMIIACDNAFHSVLSEFLPDNVNSFKTIRTTIAESLCFLECIRWDNYTKEIGLNFKGLSFGVIYSGLKMQLNVSECIAQIEKSSSGKQVDSVSVRNLVDKCADLFNLCNGHDFISTLREYINSTRNSNHLNDNTLSSSLRVAYSLNDFKQTDLYNALNWWAIVNQHALFAA